MTKERVNLNMTSTPDFLIVGAAKSGTSSLHSYLSRHPDIYMPEKRKELYFWHVVSNKNKSIVDRLGKECVPLKLEDYLSYFENAKEDQFTGEACPSYLYYYEHVLDNLKKYHSSWSDIKIIIILRNPIDRIASQYKFVCKKNLDPESLSFSASLAAERDRLKNNKMLPDLFYTDVSKYVDQVSFYLNNFNNVHVCLYDELKDRPKELLEELCKFIGVDAKRLPSFEFEVVNASNGAKKIKYPFFNRLAHRLGSVLFFWLPVKHKKRISANFKSLVSEPIHIPEKELETLKATFSEEIKMLEILLQRDLSLWKR